MRSGSVNIAGRLSGNHSHGREPTSHCRSGRVLGSWLGTAVANTWAWRAVESSAGAAVPGKELSAVAFGWSLVVGGVL